MRSQQCIRNLMFICITPLLAEAADPIFLAANDPPPGFENLEVSQRSLVDIYFGNRYLTSQLASFTADRIELPNPNEIIRLIGDLNDPELISDALSGEINTNKDLLCTTDNTEACGILETPIAGVIFDQGAFRVDVFVNRRFMLTRAADVRKYLPPSDAGFALLQNFSAAVSGSTSENSTDDYTLSGQTLVAWQENSLHGNWDYSRDNNFSVSQLYGQRDYEGLEYSLGLMSSRGFGLNFTSDKTMIGGRITTSDRTREDTGFTGGMPIEVFLPTRGRVEVRRDGRLINSVFFEAGAQQLNTSTFPSGAYDIEIRIVDEQGNELSRETRFFAKQYQLPPVGEWLFFAESGQIVDRSVNSIMPKNTFTWLNRAGVSRRLWDTVSGTAAVAHVGDNALFEAGLFSVGYRYELTPAFMVSEDGDKGVNVSGRTRWGDFTVNGSYRRLWREDENVVTQTSDPQLLGSAFEQHSASASIPFLEGNLNYRYSLNKNPDITRTNSLDYRRTLFRLQDYDLDINLSFSKSGDNKVGIASFTFRYRQDQYNFRVSPRAEHRVNDSQTDKTERVRLAASWDDKDLLDGELKINGGVETGSGDERLDSSLQYSNHFGRVALNLNHLKSDTGNNTSYSGSLSTSFLTDGNVIAMGGEQRADSALVINLDGRKGDVFEVNVNGQRRGYAIAGRPSVVPLSPFERYRVSLSPSGNTLYSFDERHRFITLYPGNVVTLDYEAIPLQLLFGRLLFNGKPLSDAKIVGGLYATETDDVGMFQLESRSDVAKLKVEMENGWICHLPVASYEDHYVQQMGTIDLATAQCAPVLEGELALSKNET